MDLKSVLNTSDNGDASTGRAPPTPQQHHQARPSQGSPPSYGYRDYAYQQTPQASPAKSASQDYSHPQQQRQLSPGSYPPLSPYQGPGQYQSRPQPPPLQPPSSYHHPSSPTVTRTNSAPVASPYRAASTSTSASGTSISGYPFPPTQPSQELASPGPRYHYPPLSQHQHQKRDSYSQGPVVAAHAQSPYVQQQQQPSFPPQRPQQHQQQRQHQQQPPPQQQHSAPHASPILTPGGANHPYLQQRPQSTQASPTSTLAQREYHYGPQYAQGSPILATQPPPPDEHNRHPSHPPTPLGPPPAAAAPRHTSAASNFSQPQSPYQQRISSIGSAQTQPSPNSAPAPLPAQRLSSSHSSHESPISETKERLKSQYDRDTSLSVSPKTRVELIPNNPEQIPTPVSSDSDRKQVFKVQSMAVKADPTVTPAKRKLEDVSMSPGELEHRGSKPPPGEINGGNAVRVDKSLSLVAPKKKRLHRPQPPIWAQSINGLGKRLPTNPNFVLQKRNHSHIHRPVNGKHDNAAKNENASRHASPEMTRPQHENHAQAHSSNEPGPQDLLGPWEASILGTKPAEELIKTVADFLFIHIVNGPDTQEILDRGIQFEIEAKLGTLIDKSTNHRVDRFIDTECILNDNGRTAFKSSMTELHHRTYNDFLNNIVIQTDPRAPNGGNRVQVHYKHRREIDRFFELSPELQSYLPNCMRSRLGARSKNVRVRATYDQKTKEVLNKIIKTRVADIDIHLPTCPMDCRISVNLEMDWDGSLEELEQSSRQGERQPDRNKDRLSYTQGHYQIDLTQVTHAANGPGNTQRIEKEHELEIELAAGAVLDQGRRAMNGTPHRYQELIAGFIDNVRVLARKANEFTKT